MKESRLTHNYHMDNKAIEQIHLCLEELQMMKQLIDLKVADDFCSRILGIYVMMRVDDITKIWSHNIPQSTMERTLADGVKTQYNNGLRTVRDKLGAHYQSPSENADLFGSVKIFRSIDYANTTCLIDAIIEVQSKIEGVAVKPIGFKDPTDLRTAADILRELNSDDQAYLTCGALDVFGFNKGGLMMTTPGQIKGQYLRSIELMVDVANSLRKGKYDDIEAERMFKRLYVCMVYNYHDNLITRTDITNTAEQYEEGFDNLFLTLISPNDNRTMLEGAFADFENRYSVEPVIKRYRKVRDHACAHLDEGSTVADINRELDALDVSVLKKVFCDMLNMFNFICNSVLCLEPLTLQARIPLHGVQMETVKDIENFYGESPEVELPQAMSCTEILRSIRKGDKRQDEAKETLRKRLMSQNIEEYQQMINAISGRLMKQSITANELSAIINGLKDAKRGYPERVQRSLFGMMADNTIFKNCNAHLLWLLSGICKEDKEIDVRKLLDSIIKQGKVIPTALSLLGLLHLVVEKQRTIIIDKNKAHVVDGAFKDYCDNLKHPTEKLVIMLVLAQHWFWDQDYVIYRNYETLYTNFFEEQIRLALESYFKYIRLDDTDEIKLCKHYQERNLFILLLYRLTIQEDLRVQKPNLFAEMWKYNGFVRTKENIYEAFGVGLMTEYTGDLENAKIIFETLAKENPLNDDAIKTLEGFYLRNPRMKGGK